MKFRTLRRGDAVWFAASSLVVISFSALLGKQIALGMVFSVFVVLLVTLGGDLVGWFG